MQDFSVDIESTTDAASRTKRDISTNVTQDLAPNMTASIKLQGLDSCLQQNSSQRIAFSVFQTDALFLTPDTACTDFTVGSVILGVRANTTTACNSLSVMVNVQSREMVSRHICVCGFMSNV